MLKSISSRPHLQCDDIDNITPNRNPSSKRPLLLITKWHDPWYKQRTLWTLTDDLKIVAFYLRVTVGEARNPRSCYPNSGSFIPYLIVTRLIIIENEEM